MVGPSMSLTGLAGPGGGPAAGPSGLARGRSDGYPSSAGQTSFPGSDWLNSAASAHPPAAGDQPHSRSQSYPYGAQPSDASQSGPSTGPASSESSPSDPSSPRYAPSSSQTETPMPPSQYQFDSRAYGSQQGYPLSPPSQSSFPLSLDSPRFSREDELVGSPPNGSSFSGSLGSYALQQPRTRSLSRPQQTHPSRRGFDLNGSGLPEEAGEVFSDGENDSGEGRYGNGYDPNANAGDVGPSSASSSLGRAAGDKAGRTLPRTSNPADMNPPVSTADVSPRLL